MKNTDPRNYVRAVWVDGYGTDGKIVQWGIYDIAPCTAVGVDMSGSYALRFVYYQDANGKRWQRLNKNLFARWQTGARARTEHGQSGTVALSQLRNRSV